MLFPSQLAMSIPRYLLLHWTQPLSARYLWYRRCQVCGQDIPCRLSKCLHVLDMNCATTYSRSEAKTSASLRACHHPRTCQVPQICRCQNFEVGTIYRNRKELLAWPALEHCRSGVLARTGYLSGVIRCLPNPTTTDMLKTDIPPPLSIDPPHSQGRSFPLPATEVSESNLCIALYASHNMVVLATMGRWEVFSGVALRGGKNIKGRKYARLRPLLHPPRQLHFNSRSSFNPPL
jgi:hypothetical protein